MALTFIQKVAKVQSELKAPKSQFNKFGNYKYRNAEDILEAVKPIISKYDLVITVSDTIEIPMGGTKAYVKATANITDGEKTISVSAYARESLEQKGMNDAQITGSTSSYARKYALNGLLLIDDTQDADATNTHGKEEKLEAAKNFTEKVKAIKDTSLDDALNKAAKQVDPKAGMPSNTGLDDMLTKAAVATKAPSFRRPKAETKVSTGDEL